MISCIVSQTRECGLVVEGERLVVRSERVCQ